MSLLLIQEIYFLPSTFIIHHKKDHLTYLATLKALLNISSTMVHVDIYSSGESLFITATIYQQDLLEDECM